MFSAAAALRLASVLIAAGEVPQTAPAPPSRAAVAPAVVVSAFTPISQTQGSAVVAMDTAALTEVARREGPIVVGRLPLAGEGELLELAAVRVLGPETRIVVTSADGTERALPYDTSEIQVLHGEVKGKPGSRVVLLSSPRRVSGHIDLGGAGGRFKLSSVDPSGRALAPGQVVVYPAPTSPEALPNAPLCGHDAEPSAVAGCAPEPSAAAIFNKKLKTVQIAVDTDYDLYANFNDATATMDYIVEVFARTNAIFMHDVDVRFEIVFVRLFDDETAEPAFMDTYHPSAGPLYDYVNHWNTVMAGVPRDTGIFMSGRRDLPYGGIAYIGAVCTSSAYCVCGYLNGFPDPSYPSAGDYDTGVVAHELGHNFGAYHTPDYCPQMDQCYPPPIVPQRGSLMSYCSQTVSGGNLVTENWYHRRLRRVMRNFVQSGASCVEDDCNQNGINDISDISAGTSSDTNGNGVPDECEDCNGNAVLDPAISAGGTSTDLNTNGMPDDCEPDCNGNAVPDDRDIRLGTSPDLWGNGVPDECDADCDADGIPDYNEIQSNLALDIDRDTILDTCQDCDCNGLSDLEELEGARNAWVASDALNYIGEYHAVSGVRVRTSTAGVISSAQDLIIVPGQNRVLVSAGTSNKVVSYDAMTGAYTGDFVSAGSGVLNNAAGLVMGPNGNLFVSSRNDHRVLQYNGTTGVFIGTFVAAGSGGLTSPFGLTFGPNGNLFVGSDNQVFEYDGTSGAFVRIFVSSADNGGLSQSRGLLFKPDGNLLVASYNTDAILEYDGTTGAFLGVWNSGGCPTCPGAPLYLDGPWGLRLGPTGNVFCTRDLPASAEGEGDHDHVDGTDELHVTAARILEFDIDDGQYLRAYILGDDTGLVSPTGFDFMAGDRDSNFNMVPDQCELPACGGGECAEDCDANLVPDLCDVSRCTGDPACGDCNTNLVPDACDIADGVLADENNSGIPDICEPPPAAVPEVGGEVTRAIALSAPPPTVATGAFGQTAIEVTMLDLQNPDPPNNVCCLPPDFSDYEAGTCSAAGEANGCARWLGPPALYLEAQELPALGSYTAARLRCTPYYRDWSGDGVVHVVGAEIVPSSTYSVKVYAAACKGNEAACLAVSEAATLTTRRAGDISAPYAPEAAGQPNAIDVVNAVNHFKKLTGAPSHIAVQVQPNVTNLNADVDALDIAAIVRNVKLLAYPYSGPCPCPSAVPCDTTECASNSACTGLYGAGALCMRTCASGSPREGGPCTANRHCGSCVGGSSPGIPCDADAQCPGGTCTTGTCAAQGYCRDSCGRCE